MSQRGVKIKPKSEISCHITLTSVTSVKANEISEILWVISRNKYNIIYLNIMSWWPEPVDTTKFYCNWLLARSIFTLPCPTQVEQEKLAKCLEKKARLREQVTDLKSLLTVSQDDCHRHYLAERQLQDRVDELENKVTQLETKNKPVLEAQTSNDSDLLFHSICKSFSQFSCYSSGSSSNSSHSASPPDTPIATVPSTPPSPSSSPHFSNHSPSHAPHNFSSYSPRNTPDSSPNESSSNSTHHFLSHSPKPLTWPLLPITTEPTTNNYVLVQQELLGTLWTYACANSHIVSLTVYISRYITHNYVRTCTQLQPAYSCNQNKCGTNY